MTESVNDRLHRTGKAGWGGRIAGNLTNDQRQFSYGLQDSWSGSTNFLRRGKQGLALWFRIG